MRTSTGSTTPAATRVATICSATSGSTASRGGSVAGGDGAREDRWAAAGEQEAVLLTAHLVGPVPQHFDLLGDALAVGLEQLVAEGDDVGVVAVTVEPLAQAVGRQADGVGSVGVRDADPDHPE
jgi:hypothetical protein